MGGCESLEMNHEHVLTLLRRTPSRTLILIPMRKGVMNPTKKELERKVACLKSRGKQNPFKWYNRAEETNLSFKCAKNQSNGAIHYYSCQLKRYPHRCVLVLENLTRTQTRFTVREITFATSCYQTWMMSSPGENCIAINALSGSRDLFPNSNSIQNYLTLSDFSEESVRK